MNPPAVHRPIETDAIIAILMNCVLNRLKLFGSSIIEYEIGKNPDIIKRNKALGFYTIAKEKIALNDNIKNRATELQKYKIGSMDSLHLASSEYGKVNVLLTVDNDFIKFSQNVRSAVQVINPVNWYMEVTNDE
ncbi:hypothetical protein FACS1894172_19530 [Spirochaetia bacterium]|nr:hypothetical protein FACS1894172_19530 [Spirochaetia bacterium]